MSREGDSGSGEEGQVPRRHQHRGGRINRFEPINTMELNASPLTVSCFQNIGCYQFCEKVQRVQNHPEMTRLFILNLHEKQVNLAGVKFDLSLDVIVISTGIPSVGEKWFRKANLYISHYEPFLKPRYKDYNKSIFPFSHFLERYAPMMRVIMKYFTCEGIFSRLYSYHIRFLMHFTRVKMLHLPYYL